MLSLSKHGALFGRFTLLPFVKLRTGSAQGDRLLFGSYLSPICGNGVGTAGVPTYHKTIGGFEDGPALGLLTAQSLAGSQALSEWLILPTRLTTCN